MLFSDGTVQVNFYGDHTKLILSGWEPLLVTFVARNRSACTYLASHLRQLGCSRTSGSGSATLCACSGTAAPSRCQLQGRPPGPQAWGPCLSDSGPGRRGASCPLVPHWGLRAESPRESGTSFTRVGGCLLPLLQEKPEP